MLGDVARRRDGWANIQAVLDPEGDGVPDLAPTRAGMFGFLSSRGPAVPVTSWVPGKETGRATEPDSLGIQHSAGPRAILRLANAGVPLPEGWTRLSDHARRGLVLSIPAGSDPAVIVSWLLRASDALAPGPLPETWVAVIHRR